MYVGHRFGTIYHLNDDTRNISIIEQITDEKALDVHLTDMI